MDEFKDTPSSGSSGTGTGTGGEDATCEPGEAVSCYEGPDNTANIGICKTGQKTCNDQGTTYGSCDGQKAPEAEACTSPADENCDSHDCVIWSKIFGDASNQSVNAIALDSEGNIFVTGTFSGTLAFSVSDPLTADARALYLAKFTAEGAPVWSRKFGGAYASTTSLTVDSEDNVILVGDFQSQLHIEDTTLNVDDQARSSAYVAKWNPSGTLSWAISEAVSQEVLEIAGAATVTLGNVFVYGRDSCRSVCGIAGEGLWLCKYNANGHRTWCKHFVGSDSQEKRLAGDIAIDRMNDIYITGSLASNEEARPVEFGGPVIALRSDLDGFIVKLDNDGNFKAQQTIHGPGEQISVGIATDKDNNVIVLANHDSMTTVGIYRASSAGMRDILVAKLNSELSCVWNRSIGGSGDEAAIALAVADDGTISVTGRAQGEVDYGGGPLDGAGGIDLPLIKLAPDGAHVWSKRFGDDRNQISKAVTMLPSGEPILGGDIEGSVDLGAGTLYSSGGSDILLARFGR
ncbi:SBBP repeat-containing protein [Sorangium sp. So ce1078]|uniref:SBBP repeat-containing protein n=1 Tax=Sorangium sp. So ce1078 TaxID=3133329 RepID=UPI003F600268